MFLTLISELLRGHKNHVNVLRIRNQLDKNWLFSGSWDKSVLIWDIKEDKNTLLKKLSPGIQVRCLQINKFREQLVLGAFEGKLQFWAFGDLSDFQKKSMIIF